ncbi:hypothetical protein PENTCL1PPCAC_5277, partial [Pristionchus entomophagus]
SLVHLHLSLAREQCPHRWIEYSCECVIKLTLRKVVYFNRQRVIRREYDSVKAAKGQMRKKDSSGSIHIAPHECGAR